jgi:hypothetical protein
MATVFVKTRHRHQQIVEIVRDPAGQVSDGFHFLGLKQRLPCVFKFLLSFLSLSDIARDFRISNKLTLIIVEWHRR